MFREAYVYIYLNFRDIEFFHDFTLKGPYFENKKWSVTEDKTFTLNFTKTHATFFRQNMVLRNSRGGGELEFTPPPRIPKYHILTKKSGVSFGKIQGKCLILSDTPLFIFKIWTFQSEVMKKFNVSKI